MNEFSLPTLSEIESNIWRELQDCIGQCTHGWRTPVLATTDARGNADARVLVLREVVLEARLLRFFTDARSPKCDQIRQFPRGALLMWSPKLNWQLRLAVGLDLRLDGTEVSSLWSGLARSPAAKDYLSPLAPGSALANALDQTSKRSEARHEQRTHFALLDATVQSIDWLELSAQGHRRARFDARGARWLQP